jgi:formylglycine-generating enzyme required for sulfatase activity
VEDALALSRTGDFAGTPYYMSPEQAMSQRIGIDYRTDVYSLGVTLYEMLCLKLPFEGKTSHDVLRQIILIDPRDPHKTNSKVPRDLSTICLKAMEKHPEGRYQSMTEFGDDLERFLSGDVILAKPSGLGTRLWKRVKRNPVLSAALAVAILAILIFATVVPWIIATNEKKAKIEIDKQRKIADDRLKLNYQLAARKDIEKLLYDARSIWPAHPDNVEAYESWINRADDQFDRVAEYQNELETLRGQALPYPEEIKRRDRETHPEWKALLILRDQREELARKIVTIEAGGSAVGENVQRESPISLEKLKEELADLDEKMKNLEEEVFRRRTWDFEDPETKQWHDHLAGLISEIEDLLGQQQNTRKDINVRLEFARTVRKRSIDDHRDAWDRAIASIADRNECPCYNGLKISEQLGLVPLGKAPASGLWEFAQIRTGDIPERGEDGRLNFSEKSGLIFVLIPGGSFQMGSRRPSAAHPVGSPNVDPMSVAYERPVHEVRIDPFFLSKYEMTQGQWSRFRFHNPSGYMAGEAYRGKKITLLHPVEYVSWKDCNALMYQLGLRLPTEAEWEYACRAGTTTVYWTGDEKESLEGAANLYDLFYKKGDDRPWAIHEEWLDDGYHLHAPVGSYRPNPFGLYDMHGNVSEWCLDAVPRSMNYEGAPADGSAVKRYQATTYILRGGSYFKLAVLCRSACRSHDILTMRYMDNGIRPACSLK